MLVEILIAKAAERQGSKKAVAEMLGVSSSYLSDLKSGRRKIQPDDLAAIAHLAGMNALNFLALATLEQAKGTAKEKVLQEALGESIRQLESTLLSGSTPQKSSNSRDIQCILCKVDQTHVARASKKLKALTERKQRSSLTD
jgi:transcriptional regulator with XRE-family HTH domain